MEKREHLYTVGGNVNWCSMEFPQKTQNRTTIWSSNYTLGQISVKNENTNLKRYMHYNIAAVFTIAKILKQPKCPSTDDLVKKMWYTYMIINQSQKEWNIVICSNMDGPREHYAYWNKSDRERQVPCDIAYMWNLKNKTNECMLQNRNRLTDIESKLVITSRKREGARENLGVWD